jgi:transposase-like protein
MSERVKFIAAYLECEASFTDLCRDFGVSRKTGYKWVCRYELDGPAGLEERSRAAHTHPNSVPAPIVQAILAVRRRHPRWGPRKLRAVLQRERPRTMLPAASTIGDILKRSGLVRRRRRVRRSSPYGDRLRQYDAPNAVWCADFKGCFSIGGQRGGERCHPLTISDGFSRYLLRCHALRRPLHRWSKRVFESAFCEYGLPRAIRTDNGPPFSTLAPGGRPPNHHAQASVLNSALSTVSKSNTTTSDLTRPWASRSPRRSIVLRFVRIPLDFQSPSIRLTSRSDWFIRTA